MKRISIVWIFLITNVSAIFFAFNPRMTNCQDRCISTLFFEAVFIPIVGIPVLLYQIIKKKKTFKQSVSDSLGAVLDFLSGVV